jgi:ribonuclease PH|tara:strand:+ start:1043 stop:1273 length:231 start_codon:yes stop_codon:yes gene_type:complete
VIITITNDSGETLYDVNKIKDDNKKQEATIIINKAGQLQVVVEALDFAARTHRINLEKLLEDCKEAVIEPDKEDKK